jgi:hypothetical protein
VRRELCWIALVLAPLLGACDAGFESPELVIDLRVLGMRAEPPEVLIPEDIQDLDLADLPEIEICALVADPFESRRLAFAFSACVPNNNRRCEGRSPLLDLRSGSVDDPEEADAPVEICATIGPSPGLLEVVQRSITLDALQGFGAVDIQVEVKVWPEGNNLDQAIYASKKMRFGIAMPAERVANRNPTLETIRVARDPTGVRGLDFDMPIGRCADIEPMLVAPDERLMFLPVESEDAREAYVVPTLGGDVDEFVENLSYQFYASGGKIARFTTGGTRDIFGNEPTLHSYWRAPTLEDSPDEEREVALWVIQRDERGGQTWFPSCARVVP